jgi:5S rRNA maturation endonuclease (ribonuclease M5)
MKDPKEELDELMKHIEWIKDRNLIVIVEGKKDVAALKYFGIKRIKPLSKRAIYKVVEEIAENNKECVILTDLDKEGKRLFRLLNHDLNQNGVRVNKKFREFLFRYTKLRQIEGLVTYAEHLREKS